MDRDYRSVAKRYNFPVDIVKGDDLSQFRIERARFRSSWYFLGCTVCSVIGYGWAIAYKVVRAPFIQSFGSVLADDMDKEYRGSFDFAILHRCFNNLSFQYVWNFVDRLEPTKSGPCAGIIESYPLCSVCLRACGTAENDQPFRTRVDIHYLFGIVLAHSTNDTS